MARPRYSAAKRAREIRKQEERARKLARKHGRSAQRASGGAPDTVAPESLAPDTSSVDTPGASEAVPTIPEGTPEPQSRE